MATQYSVATRNNNRTSLNTDIGINAQIIVYSGVIPANVATALTGTALVQFAGNATTFGAIANGVLTAGAVASSTGLAGAGTGTIGTHYRINTSAGVAVTQGTAGGTGSGADMILTNTSIASGQAVNFTSLTITASGA